MPTKLKPFLLPKLVEARRSEESKDIDMDSPDLSNSHHTPNSTASELPSPVTPTFSLRAHARHDSPASSFDLAFQTVGKGASPPSSIEVLESYQTGLRSLPDVKEEPLERDEDYDMLDGSTETYNCFCDDHHDQAQEDDMIYPSVAMTSPNSYDLADGFASDNDFGVTSQTKKWHSTDSSLNGIATRLGSRFPSFSRRWKPKKISSGSTPECIRDSPRSITVSSRTSSMTRSVVDISDKFDSHVPLTPNSMLSEEDECEGLGLTMIDTEKANGEDGCARGAQATTPLLPPLMVPESSAAAPEPEVQSPLQSPTVAEKVDPFALFSTPAEVVSTPQMTALPSPPLSTKPSMSSLHHQTAGHLVPSHEIPGIKLADPDDRWARQLGHANFDIHPEPYCPEVFDVESCRQFRANWDQARCNFTKHLVRTGEHYGVTSKTYKLTAEKWSEIDAEWRKHHDLAIVKTADMGEMTTTLREETPTATKVLDIPSLNDPRSEGKFPKLGDEVIVGPMVQIASQLQRKRSKKAAFLKFFQDVKFPGELLGRACGGSPPKSP